MQIFGQFSHFAMWHIRFAFKKLSIKPLQRPLRQKTGIERSEMPREKSEIQLLEQEEGGKQFSFLRFADLVGAE